MQVEGGTFRGGGGEEEAWDYYGTRKDCVSSRWREIILWI